MYLAPTSTIVLVVAAALALLAALLSLHAGGLVLGLATAVLLGLGSINPLVGSLGLGSVDLGSYQINDLAVAGNITAILLGLVALAGLLAARREDLELGGKAEAAFWSISRTSPFERRRRVMKWIPSWLSSLSLAYVVNLESKISSSGYRPVRSFQNRAKRRISPFGSSLRSSPWA